MIVLRLIRSFVPGVIEQPFHMRIRSAVVLMGIAFVVTLAIVVGLRLSTEAMAVIVGVIAGVAASIPTSLMVTWLTTRYVAAAPVREPQANEPRLVYVNATPPPAWPDAMQSPTHIPSLTTSDRAAGAPRHFTGLGGLEEAAFPANAPPRVRVRSVSVIGGLE
jgi:hypothetical protein